MRKRFFSILFVSMITTGLLSGCASNSPEENSSDTSSEINVSTAVAKHDMASLVSYSDLIVAGTVSTVQDFRLSEDGLYNTSHIEVSTSDIYKGNILAGAKVVVEINSYEDVPGVKVEDEQVLPVFSSSDNVLLFLKENDHGSFYIVGINQGAYFESDGTKNSNDYHRQNVLGYGPESVSLDDLSKYLNE